jgi:transcriptional regulator with XRE-family HTH domain
MKNNFDRYLKRKLEQHPQLRANLSWLGTSIDIASQLYHLRLKRNLTQEALAEKVNLKQPHIARWENPGYSGYTFSRLSEVATALDATLVVRLEPNESAGSASLSSEFQKDIETAVLRADNLDARSEHSEKLDVRAEGPDLAATAKWSEIR